MTEADKYSAIETLRDGGRIQIRALTPEDGADLSEAVVAPVMSHSGAVSFS